MNEDIGWEDNEMIYSVLYNLLSVKRFKNLD